jgi:hypothetical protein
MGLDSTEIRTEIDRAEIDFGDQPELISFGFPMMENTIAVDFV